MRNIVVEIIKHTEEYRAEEHRRVEQIAAEYGGRDYDKLRQLRRDIESLVTYIKDKESEIKDMAVENRLNDKKFTNLEIIDSLIQEIKQDPSISISQRNYAIKKMEELAKSV